jgi:hypothetical protein
MSKSSTAKHIVTESRDKLLVQLGLHALQLEYVREHPECRETLATARNNYSIALAAVRQYDVVAKALRAGPFRPDRTSDVDMPANLEVSR